MARETDIVLLLYRGRVPGVLRIVGQGLDRQCPAPLATTTSAAAADSEVMPGSDLAPANMVQYP
jgi:hypothetical protein